MPSRSGGTIPSVTVEVLVEQFELACASAGGVFDHRMQIAGRPVHMRFAGPSLAERIAPAFRHLTDPRGGEAALTVNLWDSSSTGIDGPPLPQAEPDAWAPGALYHYRDENLRFVYQPQISALSVLHSPSRTAWYWIADGRDLPFWDCAAPLRQILHWWLGTQGCQQVHGGAVGTRQGGVLLVGKPGSGKSTASLAVIGSELRYAGDDYVAVSLHPTPWVHSLYSSGKLDAEHVARFPRLASAVSNPDSMATEKAIVYVHDHYPESTATGFPLRAVVIPQFVAGVPLSLAEAPSSAALRALAPSSIIQLQTADQSALTMMARLVRSLPSYVLELGSDISAIPETIGRLLSSLDGARHP